MGRRISSHGDRRLCRVIVSRIRKPKLNTDRAAFGAEVYTVAYRVYKGTFIIAREHVRRATRSLYAAWKRARVTDETGEEREATNGVVERDKDRGEGERE